MPLTLRRVLETSQGTIGQITFGDGATLYSMERQSVGEHPRIPAGLYEIVLGMYNKGGYPAYEVIVPGRSEIKIHAANLASELLGCIAPGKQLGFYMNTLAVLQSHMAVKMLMEKLGGVHSDYLTVQDPV